VLKECVWECDISISHIPLVGNGYGWFIFIVRNIPKLCGYN
jgi:hypothetical protein